eukprot:TRINITY_DN11196_c0_g1_i3.p1 TRINITY_DN11196_c0_g1~~TRINITY_DN11196_c0_g1_i3.p1  ORF type:complete len:1099 (+),score=216.37 TRINITY_DN11196_c0_g1_i3:113-3409(+)
MGCGATVRRLGLHNPAALYGYRADRHDASSEVGGQADLGSVSKTAPAPEEADTSRPPSAGSEQVETEAFVCICSDRRQGVLGRLLAHEVFVRLQESPTLSQLSANVSDAVVDIVLGGPVGAGFAQGLPPCEVAVPVLSPSLLGLHEAATALTTAVRPSIRAGGRFGDAPLLLPLVHLASFGGDGPEALAAGLSSTVGPLLLKAAPANTWGLLGAPEQTKSLVSVSSADLMLALEASADWLVRTLEAKFAEALKRQKVVMPAGGEESWRQRVLASQQPAEVGKPLQRQAARRSQPAGSYGSSLPLSPSSVHCPPGMPGLPRATLLEQQEEDEEDFPATPLRGPRLHEEPLSPTSPDTMPPWSSTWRSGKASSATWRQGAMRGTAGSWGKLSSAFEVTAEAFAATQNAMFVPAQTMSMWATSQWASALRMSLPPQPAPPVLPVPLSKRLVEKVAPPDTWPHPATVAPVPTCCPTKGMVPLPPQPASPRRTVGGGPITPRGHRRRQYPWRPNLDGVDGVEEEKPEVATPVVRNRLCPRANGGGRAALRHAGGQALLLSKASCFSAPPTPRGRPEGWDHFGFLESLGPPSPSASSSSGTGQQISRTFRPHHTMPDLGILQLQPDVPDLPPALSALQTARGGEFWGRNRCGVTRWGGTASWWGAHPAETMRGSWHGTWRPADSSGFVRASEDGEDANATSDDYDGVKLDALATALASTATGSQWRSPKAPDFMQPLHRRGGFTATVTDGFAKGTVLMSRSAWAPSDRQDAPGSVVEGAFGIYEMGALLPPSEAGGWWGQKFIATDKHLSRRVVLWALLPPAEDDTEALKKAVEKQLRRLRGLRHARLCPYFAAEEVKERFYIVMGYSPGGSVADWIADAGPLGEAPARRVVAATLEGLAYLHYVQVPHGAIRSANVLLGPGNALRLGDFGLTALRSSRPWLMSGAEDPFKAWLAPELHDHRAQGLEEAETVSSGEPQFVGDAQTRRKGTVKRTTAEGDLWAAGCLAVEISTGAPPAEGVDQRAADSLEMARIGTPPLPPLLPSELRELPQPAHSFVQRCLRFRPEERTPADALLSAGPWLSVAVAPTRDGRSAPWVSFPQPIL